MHTHDQREALPLTLTNEELNTEQPHSKAPDPAALAAFLKWLSKQRPQRRIIGLAAEYAAVAGSRKVEFLDIVRPQVDRQARVVRTKRAKQRGIKRGEIIEEIEITPKLLDLPDRIDALHRRRIGTACTCSRTGMAATTRPQASRRCGGRS